MATPTTFNSSSAKNVNTITDGANLYETIINAHDDGSGSVLQYYNPTTLVQNNDNILMMNSNGIHFKTPSNVFLQGTDLYETLMNSQRVVQNDDHRVVFGDSTDQHGKASSKQVEAAKNLQKATTAIDQKKMDTIKNTEGQEVPCPNCSQEVLTDRGYCLLDLAVSLIRLAIPNFPYPLDILQQILDFLGIQFLTPQTVKELNGGQGCGSPGCNAGMVKSPQEPIQKANEQAANDLKSQQQQLGQYQKDMGSGGSKVIGPFMGDVSLHVGHPEAMNTSPTVVLKDNGTTPFALTNKTTPQGVGYIPSTVGNCKQAIYSDPLINPGSFSLTVNQKFDLTVGSPGVTVKTSGKYEMMGSVVDVSATEGELMLRSRNKTTLAGKNVIIDGNDGSGDSGIHLNAKNVYVSGALHIQGDHAIKGHLSMDGGLTTTHITCPGERVASAPSGSPHQVHSSPTWSTPTNGFQALVYDAYDKIYKKASRDLFNLLSLNIINGMAEIKTLIEEAYHSIMIKLPIDNTTLPTGYGTTWFAPPGSPTGAPLLIVGVTKTGIPVKGFVIPGQTLPIFTFPHNHNSPGDNHSHDYTSLLSHPVGNNTTARAARPEPSNVPSPAKSTGHGSKPGHKNMGSLCLPCINPFGGHGKRNAGYGLGPDDSNAFPGTNYVPADGKFDQYGNLTPPPSIDLNC
jgi:hypothetical protein